MLRNSPPADADVGALERRATNLRRHMLTMARGQRQGYIGQGLGIADALAALYFHELRYDPHNLDWVGRDRFLLSTGHYSIALWAALVEAGILPVAELSTYGADDSRLEMSTLDSTPGVEVIGGSLGHGLGQGVGQALGLRLDGSDARVFVELSDGEMQDAEGREKRLGTAATTETGSRRRPLRAHSCSSRTTSFGPTNQWTDRGESGPVSCGQRA